MLYFHHGAAEVWVLDYEERTMFAFRRDDSGDITCEEVNETYFSNALQIGISLDEIFG
jgi:Uma2 family endonuclease